MEPLPKGANFIRAKFLWEIGLHIAGNPATPYYGNRDICITIGSGSGDTYKPWLRMSCGSPILAHAVARGFQPLALEAATFAQLGEMGWRRVVMPARRYKGLEGAHACIDYSAWPLYARTALPDDDAYKIVDAIHAREREIVWEEFNAWAPYQGIGALGEETEATPRDVPLHPGAARWFRERGCKVWVASRNPRPKLPGV